MCVKVVAIIQARMGSTRLPGKVMMNIADKTVLCHVIERVKQARTIDEVVIASTQSSVDDVIEIEARKQNVLIHRGSEEDVLSRYYDAAKITEAEVIVRITSDCPLIDPKIIDEVVHHYKDSKYDIVTNAGSEMSQRTYPRGLDVEVFSFHVLEKAFFQANKTHQREHVTPYIYETSNNIKYYKQDKDDSSHRWTLDTPEDLELIKEIYRRLYKGNHDFYLNDILEIVRNEPELNKINAHVEQKKL